MKWGVCVVVFLAAASTGAAQPISFEKDVAPILQQHCLRCHQPGFKKGDLSLATFADLKEAGHVVAGKPEESTLLKVVNPGEEGKKPAMPRSGRALTKVEVEILRRWIVAGADWPKDLVLRDATRADASWWSLQPLAQREPPLHPKSPKEWATHPIDRFVYAKLAEKGLTPSPPADQRTLLRRVTYDLIGLPPTPAEIDAFLKDTAPDAYEKVVDRLLASPHYGEQWGRHWLDVVRFGESNGFERNVIISNVWPFRDYIIHAFNEDRPFDQLVAEHLAGDVVARGIPEREIGTAFLVCGPYDNVGNSDPVQRAMIRANTIDELIRTTSEAFLGLTVGCARCHDHKFDPIAARDYYSMYATLAGTQHGERPLIRKEGKAEIDAKRKAITEQYDKLIAERNQLKKSDGTQRQRLAEINRELPRLAQQIFATQDWPKAWAGRFDAGLGSTPVFLGGDPQKKGDVVSPAGLASLKNLASHYQLKPETPEPERRLALAKWIVAKDNPLTPRVLANRLWHYHFGVGIVDTPSDFGFMGGRPTHPELLDWLANQVHVHGWKQKPLHRMMVTSQTYRQASTYRDEAAKVDGESRLLWRFPPRRLTGEEVRDTMLSLGDKLDLGKMGGPGFRLYKYVEDNVAAYLPLDVHGPETFRRAVYHHNARAARVDVLSDFDCPDPAQSAPRRAATTTPLQALALLNHRFTFEMASALAARVESEAGTSRDAQITLAFVLAYTREPAVEELARARASVERAGMRALCQALLNSNELVFLR